MLTYDCGYVVKVVFDSTLKGRDRLLLVLLASKVRAWCQALPLVKPETLLKWHRELFHLVWKHKTAKQGRKPPVAAAELQAAPETTPRQVKLTAEDP